MLAPWVPAGRFRPREDTRGLGLDCGLALAAQDVPQKFSDGAVQGLSKWAVQLDEDAACQGIGSGGDCCTGAGNKRAGVGAGEWNVEGVKPKSLPLL